MSDGRKQPLTADWPKYYRCRTQVEEELMDHLDNVKLMCFWCHDRFHKYGPSMTKPVPKKVIQ